MLHPPLTDRDYLELLLKKAGVRPARSAGQNFLVSDEVVAATVASVQAGPPQVTELGAGVGTLTTALIAAGTTVRAIERDTRLAALLPAQIPAAQREHVALITDDLQQVDWTWDTPYQIVGNIPYNLSGLILRRLSQLDPTPAQVILLVQQEVGERLMAAPPDMHLLSIAVQLWATPHLLLQVPASCFWPEPQVDSQLLLLLPRTTDAQSIAEREAIVAFAKPLFQNRRKQLGGVLSKLLGQPLQTTSALLGSVRINPHARPQELSLAQWQELYKSVKRKEPNEK